MSSDMHLLETQITSAANSIRLCKVGRPAGNRRRGEGGYPEIGWLGPPGTLPKYIPEAPSLLSMIPFVGRRSEQDGSVTFNRFRPKVT